MIRLGLLKRVPRYSLSKITTSSSPFAFGATSSLDSSLSFRKTRNFDQCRHNSSKSSEIIDKLPDFSMNTESAAVESATNSIMSGAVDHIGFLSEHSIVNSLWWPPDVFARILEAVYVTTGMPWWATILSVTIGSRLLIFPFYMKSADTSGRMSQIRDKTDILDAQMRESSHDTQALMAVRQRRSALMKKYGIKHRYMFYPVALQIPFALGMFAALRRMAENHIPGFDNEGFAWFTDLASTDPYLGLQLLTAATVSGFLWLGGETGTQTVSKKMKYGFTALSFGSIFFTMGLPSAVVFFFAVSGIFSMIQSSLLKNASFKSALNITPFTPPLNPKGFGEMWKQAQMDTQKRREVKELQEKAAEFQKNRVTSAKVLKRSTFKRKN